MPLATGGVKGFDVSILVVGGDEDGSCIASIRRATSLLNAFLFDASDDDTSGKRYRRYTHNSIMPDQPTKLFRSLFRRFIEEVVQTIPCQNDGGGEYVHPVEHGEVTFVL